MRTRLKITDTCEISGVPRQRLRVIERFSSLDKDNLLYRFTVYDSDYNAPYSGEFPWPIAPSTLHARHT